MKRFLLILLILAVVGAGVSFVAAPLVAFAALRSSAQAEDVQGLAKLVDFDQVRASLAPQLDGTPGVQAPPPSVLKDPLGALKRAIEPITQAVQPTGPKPDDYLKPAALGRLTAGAGRDAWRPSPTADEAEPAKTKLPTVSHWGINRTRLSVADPADATELTVFSFERRGPFEWKLVHIGLPSDEEQAVAPVRGGASGTGGADIAEKRTGG